KGLVGAGAGEVHLCLRTGSQFKTSSVARIAERGAARFGEERDSIRGSGEDIHQSDQTRIRDGSIRLLLSKSATISQSARRRAGSKFTWLRRHRYERGPHYHQQSRGD